MEIQRTNNLNRLIELQHIDNIKVITGIRRCDKSVILNQLYNHFSKIIIVSTLILRNFLITCIMMVQTLIII